MTDETRVTKLLALWQELRQSRPEITPEEVCASCPELLGPLKECLRQLGLDPYATQALQTAKEPLAPPADSKTVAPATDPFATRAISEPAPSPSLPEWPSIPGYDITGELGRGGMGAV